MFCGNCGKEVNTKFCSNCGEKIIANMDTSQDEIEKVNHGIDIEELRKMFGSNKVEAIKYVKNISSLSLSEAKTFVDNAYASDTSNATKGFFSKSAQLAYESKVQKQELKEKLKQYDKEGTPYCPKCYSTSLTADKKGFGIGKAVAGTMVAGPLGLMAGNLGAKKVRVTCLKCGKQFMAGK